MGNETTVTEPTDNSIDFGNLFEDDATTDSGAESQEVAQTESGAPAEGTQTQTDTPDYLKSEVARFKREFQQVEEGTHPIVVKGINEVITHRDSQWVDWFWKELKESGLEAQYRAKKNPTQQAQAPAPDAPAQDDPLKSRLDPVLAEVTELKKWMKAKQEAERKQDVDNLGKQLDSAIAAAPAQDLTPEQKAFLRKNVIDLALVDSRKGQTKGFDVYVQAVLAYMGRAQAQVAAQTPPPKAPVTIKNAVATSGKSSAERLAAKEKEYLSQIFTE